MEFPEYFNFDFRVGNCLMYYLLENKKISLIFFQIQFVSILTPFIPYAESDTE